MKKKMLASKILIFVVGCFWLLGCQSKLDEKSVSAKAQEIHSRVLTLDTHCDTASNMLRRGWDMGERHSLSLGQRESGRVDLPRMVEGGLDAEFFAAFVGQGDRTPEGYAKAKEQASMVLDAIHKMCEKYPRLVGLATSPEDAYQLKKEGKRIAFIGMENGYPVDKDLSLLKFYYDQGVRYLTLCHSRDNDICDSSTDREHREDNGLSDFGRQAVLECNRLGMMVDVSHSSDKSFYDVLKVTKAPVIASHSCCRAVCDSPRNLTDDMLKALASNGGVIQICFLSSYVKKPKPNPERDKAFKEFEQKHDVWRGIKDEALREKIWEEYEALHDKFPEDKATLKDLVDHIDHVLKVVGVDYVGIGTDFDGGGGVVGCDDVSQMYHVTEELLRRGYSDEEIEKIWGGNAMRVFRKVREIAEPVPSEAKESRSSR